MALPTTTDEWILESTSLTTTPALRLNNTVPVPPVSPNDVLLEIRAVSLNFRDLAIARVHSPFLFNPPRPTHLPQGRYPLPTKFPLIPTSDASAIVLATGTAVKTLHTGANVIILPAPLHQSGHLTTATHAAPGDGFLPGLLRRHVVVPASWVAPFPSYLSFIEAATLGGAGVTAWNVLFGCGIGAVAAGGGPRAIKAGDTVLTQGTGAVAMFTAGFAVNTGARVIGTTGSDKKAGRLSELGVSEVINYRVDEQWGETARAMTEGGEGVDLVVDVGGVGTLGQSLKAIRYDGTVAVTGFLSGNADGPGPSLMEVLPRAANVRGILAGSRAQYEDMVEKMEEWQFRPVVDRRVFGFEEAKEAYEYLWTQQHIGKVVIEVGK